MGGTSCLLSRALPGVIVGKNKERNLAIVHREWKIKAKCHTPNDVWLLLITNESTLTFKCAKQHAGDLLGLWKVTELVGQNSAAAGF